MENYQDRKKWKPCDPRKSIHSKSLWREHTVRAVESQQISVKGEARYQGGPKEGRMGFPGKGNRWDLSGKLGAEAGGVGGETEGKMGRILRLGRRIHKDDPS